jgi:ketosteroid isomerase-like protein
MSKQVSVVARKPEECDSLLIDLLNRGDLEAAVGLYEPNATLFSDASAHVVGRAAIRETLKGYLGFDSRITEIRAVKSADGVLALTGGKWTSNGKDSGGKPVALSGKSVEVVRRQPDGRWLFSIDNPWGAE